MSDDPIRSDPAGAPARDDTARGGLRDELDRTRETVREEAARTKETVRREAVRTAETVKREAARTGETLKREAVRTKETAQREAARTKETVADAREQFRRAVDSAAGPPATDEDEAERQLAELRTRIARDVETLRSRVPDPDAIRQRARTIGIVAAVGVGLLGSAAVLRRRSGRRKEHDRLRAQAEALARELARLEREEPAADDGRGGRGRWLWLGLGAAGGLASWVLQQRRAEDATVQGELPGPGRATEQRREPSTVEVTVDTPSGTPPRSS